MKRLNIRVTDEQVNASYERFAKGNKMTTATARYSPQQVWRDQDPFQGLHALADGLGTGNQRAGAWRGRAAAG